MKTTRILIGCCVCLLGIGGISPKPVAAVATGGPVIIPFSLGRRVAGSIVNVAVPIKNGDSTAVRIKAIRTSCGCTSAIPASRWIDPGASDKIKIRVDSINSSGPFSVAVLVTTTSHIHPVWEIRLTGFFATPQKNLVAMPSRLDLRFPRPGLTEGQIFRIQRNEQANIGRLKITTSAPWITIRELRRRRREDVLRYYLVDVTPPAGTGVVSEEIRFQGNNKGDFLRVPIDLHVLPLIGVWPNKVLLMPHQSVYDLMVRPAEAKTATLGSYHVSSKGIRIVSVRESNKLMDGKPSLVVRAEPEGYGFISATLTLRFKQWKEPVQVFFVGIGH